MFIIKKASHKDIMFPEYAVVLSEQLWKKASHRDAMFLENAGTPKYILVPAGRDIAVKDCRIYGLLLCPYGAPCF